MPRLRMQDKWVNIICIQKTGVRLAVEKEEKLVFRMVADNTLQSLGRKPANTIQTVREQQASVDSYPHKSNI